MPTHRLCCGLVLAALTLAAPGGCTSRHTFVLERPAEVTAHHGLAIALVPGTASVDEEDQTDFRTELSERLSTRCKLVAAEQAQITLQCRLVHFDEGNVALRVGSGVAGLFGSPFYGLGDGNVGVEATFLDRRQTVLARVVVDGPIAGVFASPSSGLSAAAESIAEFTFKHFRDLDAPDLGEQDALATDPD